MTDGHRWPHRHLLDTSDLSLPDLELVLATAGRLAAHAPRAGGAGGAPTDSRRQVGILFYEPSTRTRVSFERAAQRSGAQAVTLESGASSVTKGESLRDTCRTLAALGVDTLVIRHPRAGAAHLAVDALDAGGGSVINAGDGAHAHPTQALVDLYTLRTRLPRPLDGARIAIVGDILHSRVARSNVWSLTTAGAEVRLCGPAPLLAGFDRWARILAGERRVIVTSDPVLALRDADAVMALRIQRERMADAGAVSTADYVRRYAITEQRLRICSPKVVVLHPGPMNAGVEIAPDVAGGPHSLILDQVANGVAVRAAVLELVAAARFAR